MTAKSNIRNNHHVTVTNSNASFIGSRVEREDGIPQSMVTIWEPAVVSGVRDPVPSSLYRCPEDKRRVNADGLACVQSPGGRKSTQSRKVAILKRRVVCLFDSGVVEF